MWLEIVGEEEGNFKKKQRGGTSHFAVTTNITSDFFFGSLKDGGQFFVFP